MVLAVLQAGLHQSDNGRLSDRVLVTGNVTLKQLSLGQAEVDAINDATAQYDRLFARIILHVNAVDAPETVAPTTPIFWAMTLDAESGLTVKVRERKTLRAEIVAQMVRRLHEAAQEHERFIKIHGQDSNASTIFI